MKKKRKGNSAVSDDGRKRRGKRNRHIKIKFIRDSDSDTRLTRKVAQDSKNGWAVTVWTTLPATWQRKVSVGVLAGIDWVPRPRTSYGVKRVD